MRSRFFQAVDEENLLNRIDLLAADQGILVDYNVELRMLMYLSDKAADRAEKRKKHQEAQARAATQQNRRIRHV